MAIAEDIMEQGSPLDIGHLYNVARRVLNIQRKELYDIIKFLLGNHYLVEGTKFTRETVLAHPYRSKIMASVARHGSMHFSAIKDAITSSELSDTGSSGQLIWHLGLLLKFKHLKRIKYSNKTLFCKPYLSKMHAIINFLLQDETIQAIISHVLENGSSDKSEIHNFLDHNRDTVYYRVNKLLKDKYLIEDKSKNNHVKINPDYIAIFKEVLIGEA